jgi:hypothetical protein
MGALLLRSAKDQFPLDLLDSTGVPSRLPPSLRKDQFPSAAY